MGIQRRQLSPSIRAEMGAKVPYQWRPASADQPAAPTLKKSVPPSNQQLAARLSHDLRRTLLAIVAIALVLLIVWWRLH
jgi:hypothetical protein